MNFLSFGLFWIAWACIAAVGYAQNPSSLDLVISDHNPPVESIDSRLGIFVDSGGRFEIEEIIALSPERRESLFSEVKNKFGYTNSVVWVRVRILSRVDSEIQLIHEIPNSRLSRVDWYVVSSGVITQREQSGFVEVFSNPDSEFYPTISQKLAPGTTSEVYARIESDTAIWVPYQVGGVEAFRMFAVRRTLVWSIIIWVGLATVMFSLIMSWSFFERRLLSFAILILSLLAHYTIYHGYARVMWPYPNWWLERQAQLLTLLVGSLLTLLINHFVVRDYPSGKVPRFANDLAITTSCICILIALTVEFRSAVRFVNPVAWSTMLIAYVTCAVYDFTRKAYDQLWYNITLVIVTIGVLYQYCHVSGYLPRITSLQVFQQVFSVLLFSSFCYAFVEFRRKYKEIEKRLAASKQEEAHAKLMALQYQLNPHFLFNTLNTVNALAYTSPSRIPSIVEKLATFLRLRLKSTGPSFVPLRQEIESLRAYLDIEHVRFGDDLQTTYAIDPRTMEYPVPDLILQPLVENAIKYGFSDEQPILLHFSSRLFDDSIQVEIVNQGRYLVQSNRHSGFGIGIENIRQRLKLVYAGDAKLELFEREKSVVACITLPMRYFSQ